ncbi:MAG: hypothetical protein HQL48_05935 [Gammaproteobacteria bacterium]|nr:hypothetical protein [Gammaproteobacteria bacterium]
MVTEATDPRCADCSGFVDQPLQLESEFPGLNILSSALGSVRADSGWCRLRDLIVVSRHSCDQFQERGEGGG